MVKTDDRIKDADENFDPEKIQGSEKAQTPYDTNRISIDMVTYSIYEIIRRIRNKEIDLFPDFQRNIVWSKGQQSRLIESVLLKIPLPSFYLDATNDDRWVVVDGLQRLNTLYGFLSDKLILEELEFLNDFNGKTFGELERPMQRVIENTILSVYKITPDTPEEAKFTIFKRINTGGNPLNSQEIRHCIYKGSSTGLLKELAESDEFLQATDNSISNTRMGDRECVLRYCAFSINGFENYLRPDFDGFLSDTMLLLNSYNETESDLIRQNFKKSMKNCYGVFGDNAFRKITKDQKKRQPVNKSLFEVWSVCLQNYDKDVLVSKKDSIVEKFINLMENDVVFTDSISQGTGDVKKVWYRFEKINGIIREALDA